VAALALEGLAELVLDRVVGRVFGWGGHTASLPQRGPGGSLAELLRSVHS
jgi:hypothetical protein